MLWVEAHHFIGMVEHYHGSLQQVYSGNTTEIFGIEPNLVLQMSFKAINNSIASNGLVPILLVFGEYPKMTKFDTQSLSIT